MAEVGIFSRDSPDSYRWLKDFLYTFLPKNNVRIVTITNHSALSISGVSFAILYHSKNRGRINVTDVVDSLYDKELRDLSHTLGAENVIVVIDDLDDNSDQVKSTILENQPSINHLARDLLLFKAHEKQNGETDPTNTSNKSKIQEMITGRSAVPLISGILPSHYSTRINENFSHRRPVLTVSSIMAVLVLYTFAVYWYNLKVLPW